MTKLEYLRWVITETQLYKKKNWYISLLSILVPDTSEKYINEKINGMIYLTVNGLVVSLKDESSGNMVYKPITDYVNDKPLFDLIDLIEIDNTWLKSVTSKISTTVGTMLVNKFVLEDVVGSRVDYINSQITPSTIEKIFESKVKNVKERTDKDLSIQEMIEISDRVMFLTTLAEIVNITATEKNITRPKGIDEKKKKLVEEYKNDLTDPVKVVELENKLNKIDEEHLADDPTNGIVIAGKTMKARRKMYLMFGQDKDFSNDQEARPILQTLEEGLATNEKNYPEYNNSLRYGSYARGKLTALSGTQTKVMLRALGSLTIVDGDCGTTKGFYRDITKKNHHRLVGREIRVQNKWVLVPSEKESSMLVDKRVEMRSAMYCKSKENTYCYHCCVNSFKTQPDAIFNLSTDVTSTTTKMFLKLMHGEVKSSTELKIKDLVT